MKTVAIPFTMQIPVLSTAHMPDSAALDRLRDMNQNPVAVYDEGGFVMLPDAEDTVPDWLAPIARWAQANVYEWVRFDRDGDEVEGLEVYDWEAGNGAAMIDLTPGQTPIATVMGLEVYETPPVIKPEDNPETGVDIDLSHVVAVNETVIRATMRTQDLIPAFLKVLTPLSPSAQVVEYASLPNSYYQSALLIGDDCTWWDSEDARTMLDDLFDELNSYAPAGFYFGTHVGDGSDFGFWECEE